MHKKRYIPAMHFHWLTPWYDTLVELTLPDAEFKQRLLQHAHIMPENTILDVGCGTGILALMVKKSHPHTTVMGLDVDPEILKIAARKAQEAGLEILLHEGDAASLPYPDQSVDRVLSTFVFHHLVTEDKRRAAREAYRVLRPGGELHILDFGKPHNFYSLLVSYLLRWTEELADNIAGRLPGMFRAAGFVNVEESSRFGTLFGTVSIYQGRKPVRIATLGK